MNQAELANKRKQLRAALLKMRQANALHRVAEVTGIVGGTEALEEMIQDQEKIHLADIGLIGMHFGIFI